MEPGSSVLAILSNHDPRAWTGSACDGGANATCNLRLFEAAIARGAAAGAGAVLFPEGYALSPDFGTEPWISPAGATPCAAARTTQGDSPLQSGLACAARRQRVAVVANVLVRMGGGEKQIREVVIDAAGAVVSSYGKRHLFPSERWPLGFSPSSDAPTVAPLLGGRVGLLICYEGVYPELSGDWSQVDGLRRSGAQALLWSIGSHLPVDAGAARLARRTGLPVLASADGAAAHAVAATGAPLPPSRSVALRGAVAGYVGNASLLLWPLPAAPLRRGAQDMRRVWTRAPELTAS